MDPITIAMLGSSILGGLGNLFGGKEDYQQDLINKYILRAEESKNKRRKIAQDEIAKQRRYNEAMKQYALNKSTQKAAELGVNAPGTVYASDMAGDTEMYKTISDIETAKDKDIETIDERIANAELSKPYQEPAISRFLGGAISTAGTVGKFMPLFMDPLKKGNPGTGGGNNSGTDLIEKYAPEVNPVRNDVTKDVITDNPVINPIPKTDNGTGEGQGFSGDNMENELANALGGKRKMADKGKRMLKFYDPTAYSFLKMGKKGNEDLVNYYASLYA